MAGYRGPERREDDVRMAVMEQRLMHLEAQSAELKTQVGTMDGKLDQLLEAAAMGRGAWWMLLKVGGGLSVIAGAAAWIWDRVRT